MALYFDVSVIRIFSPICKGDIVEFLHNWTVYCPYQFELMLSFELNCVLSLLVWTYVEFRTELCIVPISLNLCWVSSEFACEWILADVKCPCEEIYWSYGGENGAERNARFHSFRSPVEHSTLFSHSALVSCMSAFLIESFLHYLMSLFQLQPLYRV